MKFEYMTHEHNTPQFLVEDINRFGQDDWELVWVVPEKGKYTAFLKREAKDRSPAKLATIKASDFGVFPKGR